MPTSPNLRHVPLAQLLEDVGLSQPMEHKDNLTIYSQMPAVPHKSSFKANNDFELQ